MMNLDFKEDVKIFLSRVKSHKLRLVHMYSETDSLSQAFKSNVRMPKSL